MLKKFLILFFIATSITMGSFAYAQVRDTDIILTISPENPGPSQEVIASLGSYVINLDKANILWSVNNEDLSQGIGKKVFSFKTGQGGSSTTLSITIDTIEGENISKSVVINPSEVVLLWEALDSYVPVFYKGKALAPSQGKFKVVAIPDIINRGAKVNPGNFSYNWILDGNPKPSASGWGKNSFTFQNSYLDKTNTVEVKISDISGGFSASAKTNLWTTDPKIIFYENNQSFGTKWESALHDGFTISQNGSTMVAEPYFFSPKNISAPELTFDWSIGGQKIESLNPKNVLSIKPEAGQSGSSVIEIVVENTYTLFQEMKEQINVNF